MQHIVQASGEYKLIVYAFVFVLWIIGQIATALKKKKEQMETPRTTRTASPPQKPVTSLDNDLKNLLAQLTGESVPAAQPPAQPPPVPTRLQPPARSLQQQRAQRPRPAIARAQNQPQQQQPRAAPPRTVAPAATATASSSPITAPAMVSFRSRDFNANMPKLRLPSIRLPSANLTQSGTGRSRRLDWLREPGTLREVMIARLALDPPKALENLPR
jgi:hypothetical protein